MGGGINGTSSRRDAETGTTWLVFRSCGGEGAGVRDWHGECGVAGKESGLGKVGIFWGNGSTGFWRLVSLGDDCGVMVVDASR